MPPHLQAIFGIWHADDARLFQGLTIICARQLREGDRGKLGHVSASGAAMLAGDVDDALVFAAIATVRVPVHEQQPHGRFGRIRFLQDAADNAHNHGRPWL